MLKVSLRPLPSVSSQPSFAAARRSRPALPLFDGALRPERVHSSYASETPILPCSPLAARHASITAATCLFPRGTSNCLRYPAKGSAVPDAPPDDSPPLVSPVPDPPASPAPTSVSGVTPAVASNSLNSPNASRTRSEGPDALKHALPTLTDSSKSPDSVAMCKSSQAHRTIATSWSDKANGSDEAHGQADAHRTTSLQQSRPARIGCDPAAVPKRIYVLADTLAASVVAPAPGWLDLADGADELARLMRARSADVRTGPK
jgi:hypothetical protein